MEKKMTTDSEILTEFSEIFRENDTIRDVREKTWFRNLLYYLGEQWLSWFEEQNTFGRRYEFDPSVPTPVSNAIRDHCRAMVSMVVSKRYDIRVWPNSNAQNDTDASKLAESILQWSNSTGCNYIEDVKENVARWLAVTGNAFCRTFATSDDGKYVTDEKGKAVTNQGEVANEAISPFNITVPILGETLQDKKYLGIKSLKDREWVEQTFNIQIEAGDNTSIVDYQKQLMSMIANVSPWKGQGVDSSSVDTDTDSMVVFQEIEYKPTKHHPKGRYFVVAGGKVLLKQNRLPIPIGNDGDWMYTCEHFRGNITPGNFWATSLVDDLISPQNTINQIDQALISNRESIGRPWILTPKELVLSRKSAVNQPFLQLEYDATTAQGLKPEVVSGAPYPQQILEERNLARQTIQEAAGDPKNILRGQSPSAQASGVMVDILKEAAEQTHTPDVERFYRSWTRVTKKRLILSQEVITEERMLKIPGSGSEIEIKQFKGADLHNNTDVRLELDNKTASTQAGRNQFVLSLLEKGFFGDLEQKPELKDHLMERFGVTVPSENNLHTERAKRENSAIVYGRAEDIKKIALPAIPVTDDSGQFVVDPKTGEPKTIEVSSDPLFRYDNHEIHISVLDELILSKEFDSLEGRIKLVAISHRKMHEEALSQQQAQQQQQLQQQMEQEEYLQKKAKEAK